MKISSWAIRHPIPIIVLFIALSLGGVASFLRLPINANPNVNFPIVSVTVTQTGASPTQLESSTTRRIEDAVSGLADVRHVSSTISDGSSATTVEFAIETDVDRVVNDVRNAISQIRDELPAGIDTPLVERVDVEGGALAFYSVGSVNLDQSEISHLIDNEIKRRLLAIPGVQQVKRLGGVTREIRVLLDPAALSSLKIDAAYINKQLAQNNADLPAGRTVLDGAENSLRVTGGAKSIEELADTPIRLEGGGSVRLGDIARVEDSHAEARSRSRMDELETAGFSVSRSKGASDTVVMQKIEEELAKFTAEHVEIKIDEIYTSANETKQSYDQTIWMLAEGAILTVLVVFVFLRDARATLVAAVSLPLSILPTFAALYLLDYTLNGITLLALMLVIGILVDDAIVEIENIKKHLALGKRPYQAAIDAADDIGFAVVAITLTIVAIFLPVSFIGGGIGQYFRQFGITVAAAVLASLLVARLATPLLAAYILKPEAKEEREASKLKAAYLNLLNFTLDHRKFTLFIGFLLLLGSFALIPLLPTGFLPQSDSGRSSVNITLAPGSTLEQTDERLLNLTRVVKQNQAVQSVFAIAGGGGETHKGELLITLKPHKQRAVTQKRFEDELRAELAKFSDMRFAFANDMAARDISVILTGEDADALSKTAALIKSQMNGVAGAKNAQVNEPLQKPEIRVNLIKKEAARLGVSHQAVAEALRIATVGDTDAASAKFDLPGRQVPIRVSLEEDARNDLEVLRKIYVQSAAGAALPLSSVAQISHSQGAASIERFDKRRKIALEADLQPGFTVGEVLEQIYALPAMKNLPSGISSPEYGDSEYMSEMFEQFGIALGFGVTMFLLVLVVLFRDFLQPATIFIALPLSIGGAAGGLLLYGAALDLSAVIGILMLMAIVGKNSILLVDFVIEKRLRGSGVRQALLSSGAERARPIVMTTIAMIAGMAPAVFASGSGAEFRATMSVAVICGLAVSTLLSLVFVPTVYSIVDDAKRFLGKRLCKLTSVTEQDKQNAAG